jgi:beta-glucosidase
MNIENLVQSLTLDEKIGQLSQLAPYYFFKDAKNELAGPNLDLGLSEEDIFLSGSVLGVDNASSMMLIQRTYLNKSRHKIPLMFMADVIHGYKTIFPVPLALSCSFNPELVLDTARISAIEAATSGIHVAFSPMLDLVRDPRWGRVMESYGEDPYLLEIYAKAMVDGYQNGDVKEDGNLAACIKHFAAYGAAEGGRDYNTVELSRHTLYQFYLRGYKAGIDAKAKLVMTSFNTIEGVPATTNKWLLKDVLRNQFDFKGTVITDFASIRETIAHGTSKDGKEAALKSLEAGVNIDMISGLYTKHLKSLLSEQLITIGQIDQAVLKVLELKQDCGLFDNPYKGASIDKDKELVLSKAHKELALKAAEESIVLLKNDKILPLKDGKKVFLLGPFADLKDTNGPWSWHGDSQKNNISLKDALSQRGVIFNHETKNKDLDEVDTVILVLGEKENESGEARSKSEIKLPKNQINLVRRMKRLGKKVIIVLYHGRPLDLTDVMEADAILACWFLGTKAADAIANVLLGIVSPSAKLTISFPRSVGQIPIYYNHYQTGRPEEYRGQDFVSTYIDVENKPLFPFGYGLSYANFKYLKLKLSQYTIKDKEKIVAEATIKNESEFGAYEIIQLYLKDDSADVVRPIKELKGFKKVWFEPMEEKNIKFKITIDELKYYNQNLEYKADEGTFACYVGTSSEENLECSFNYIK